MRFAIIGLPQAGKSTVFRVLVGDQVFTTGSLPGECGRFILPDPYLEQLAHWGGAKKVTPTDIELWDPPQHLQIKGPTASQLLGHLRTVDGYIHVIPEFNHVPGGPHPLEIAEEIERTLIGADLQLLEGRRERTEALYRKSQDAELLKEREIISRMLDLLQRDQPLRVEIWDDVAREKARQWGLLSIRPILHLVNIGETRIGDERIFRLIEEGKGKLPWAGWCYTCAPLEYELVTMEAREREEWMKMYQIEDLLPERLVSPLLKSMGVVRFYTVNPREARVWLIPRGSTALDAAGAIHSDLARGFIRAEVIPIEAIFELKDWQEGRKKGIIRQEGRDYLVMDGDVILVRFST